MSIQNEIERINQNISNSYSAVQEMGGTIPSVQNRNSDNLADAIRSISTDENSNGEIYSTEETRIGTWIDGKPIYRITIVGNFPNSDGQYYVKNISALQYMIKAYGFLYRSDNSCIQIPLSSSGFYGDIDVYSWGESIFIISQINSSKLSWNLIGNRPYYISIEYTKSTDEATTFFSSFSQENFSKTNLNDENID